MSLFCHYLLAASVFKSLCDMTKSFQKRKVSSARFCHFLVREFPSSRIKVYYFFVHLYSSTPKQSRGGTELQVPFSFLIIAVLKGMLQGKNEILVFYGQM